jgi:hypothetical protein
MEELMPAKCANCGMESQGRFCPRCGIDKEVPPVRAQGSHIIVPSSPSIQPSQAEARQLGNVNVTAPIGQMQGRFKEMEVGSVSSRGGRLVTDEGMVWEEKPNPIVLAGLVFKYFIALIVILLLYANVPSQGEGTTLLLWLVIAVGHIGLRFWEIASTKYRMTSQRLEVTAGLFNQKTVAYELYQMAPAVITRPLLLRLVKTGNLTIPSPFIILRAIRNPEVVRDLIRDFGQGEASRMDKIRWR